MKRRNIKVAADIVTLANKVAALREQTVQEYMLPVLVRCTDLLAAEVAGREFEVRDGRAVLLPATTPQSTLNTTEVVALRLASLAGQCLTSVARLLDPPLRELLTADYREAVTAAYRAL